MKKILFGLTALALFTSSVFALVVDEEYTILRGETVKLRASGINRVSVYTEGIVEAVDATPMYIEVMGMEQGETFVELGTKSSRKIFKVSVLEKDPDVLMEKLENLIYQQLGYTQINIVKNSLTNRILLEGQLPEEDMKKVEKLLGDYSKEVDNFLTKKESEDIVEIEVKIIDITETAGRNMGIQWPSSLSYGEDGDEVTLTSGANKKIDHFHMNPLFDFMETQNRSTLNATINFLVSSGQAEILSNPTLSCLSGKEASLKVGGSVPILTTADEGGTSVEFVEYGIGLSVSPVVREDELIEVNLQVDISDIDTTLELGSDTETTASAPSTTSRTTSTVVLMEQDKTLSISGLIKNTTSDTISKFPWLCDVPVLGRFFSNSNKSNEKTELVILLTPRVKKMRKNASKEKVKEFKKQVSVLSMHREPTAQDNHISEYAVKVRERILASMEYPQDALRAGWETQVKVSIHLAEDGYLLGAKLMESSGLKIFDDNLIETIKAIKYFPVFPSSITSKELWLEVPFVFSLD